MYVILLITKLCFKISFATHRLFAIFFSRSSEASISGVVGNKLFVCFTCFNGVDNVIISLCLCTSQNNNISNKRNTFLKDTPNVYSKFLLLQFSTVVNALSWRADVFERIRKIARMDVRKW